MRNHKYWLNWGRSSLDLKLKQILKFKIYPSLKCTTSNIIKFLYVSPNLLKTTCLTKFAKETLETDSFFLSFEYIFVLKTDSKLKHLTKHNTDNIIARYMLQASTVNYYDI